jgi:Pyruvate/2-oxoacid:ferredoxin oxidoreductase delta subunit
VLNNGKGAISSDKNYQVAGRPGMFCGGDVIRPHLLTTAIGHGNIAADGIDRHLRGEPQDKRPKVDVHSFDLMRKMVEKGLKVTPATEPLHGTDNLQRRDPQLRRPLRPLRHLAQGAVPRPLPVHAAPPPQRGDAEQGRGAEQLRGALLPLLEAQAQAEAKRCMSCGQCFECDNCVVYCPQTAVFKVKKAQSTMGRYVDTDYDKCIGCHICKDVCPTGYIQMGLGE